MLQKIQEIENLVSVDFIFFLWIDLASIEFPRPTLHQFETARPGKLPFTAPKLPGQRPVSQKSRKVIHETSMIHLF